jgi:hypothetical protein
VSVSFTVLCTENVNLELGLVVFINWVHFTIEVSLNLSLLSTNFVEHTACYTFKVKLSSIQQQSILYLHKSKKFLSTWELITIFVFSGPKPDESSVLHATPSHSMFKVHFNMNIRSTLTSPKCSSSFTYPHQNSVWISIFPLTWHMLQIFQTFSV